MSEIPVKAQQHAVAHGVNNPGTAPVEAKSFLRRKRSEMKGASPAAPEPRTFDREDFQGTVDLKPETVGRGFRKREVEQKVKISPETEALYSKFLEQHLIKLKDIDPKLLEELGFQSEIHLQQHLLNSSGEVDKSALALFYNDARGFAFTTMAMEQELAISKLVVGWGSKGNKGDSVQEQWAFEMLTRDPKLAEYVKKLTNIDVNDFEWNGKKVGKKQVLMAPSGIHIDTSPNTDALKKRILSMEEIRFEFLHKSLGIPEGIIRRPAEHGLRDGRINMSDLKWDRDVVDEFAANEGGWKLLITGGVDNEGNLKRYIQARERVMTRTLSENLKKMDKLTIATNSRLAKLTELQGKVGEGADQSAELKRREKDLEISSVTEDKVVALEVRSTLDSVTIARRSVDFAKAKAVAEAGATAGNEVDSLQVLIDAEKKKINDRSDPTSFDSRLRAAEADAVARRTNVRSDPRFVPGMTTKEQDELSTALREEIAIDLRNQRDQIQEDRIASGVDEEIVRLEKYKNDIKSSENVLVSDELRKKTDDVLTSFVDGRDLLLRITVGPPPTPPLGIEDSDLAMKSPNEILAKINEINKLRRDQKLPAYESWPVEANNLPETRLRLTLARAEAKANASSGVMPAKVSDYIGWGLSEAQLLTFNDKQVNDFMHDVYLKSGGTEGWEATAVADAANSADVLNVRTAVLNKLKFRSEKLKEIADESDKEKRDLEGEKSLIATSREDKERVDMALNLIGRKENIYVEAINIRRKIDRLTDLSDATVDPDPLATPTELGRKKWEMEWLQMLSDYQSEGKVGRESAFRLALKYVNPETIVRDVGARVGLKTDSSVGIDTILIGLQAQVGGLHPSSRITASDMRRALGEFINEYADNTIRDIS